MKKFFLLLAVLFIFNSAVSHSFAASNALEPRSVNVMEPGKPDPDKVKAALEEFKNLSKKEKKNRFKELKAAIRHYKAQKKAGDDVDTNTLLLVLIAIIVPPLAVYLHEKETNNKFWIDLLLAVLGLVGIFALGWYCWLAAVIYALVVVLQGK
jgi:uncharacterized membrane protein YqaE (UPF0057 family)